MARSVFCTIALLLASAFAVGQTQETILWLFSGHYNGDGSGPRGRLILDGQGNLYGTTTSGGSSANCFGFGGLGCGTVFELSPNSDGSWSETRLHSFDLYDGAFPQAGLVMDSAGNLFGTTGDGGEPTCADKNGCGAVFELSPPSAPGGVWTFSDLYFFCFHQTGCPDGSVPVSDLTMDTHGNLYGTTSSGGVRDGGTVFELSNRSGNWIKTTLYNFCSAGQRPVCPDGWKPLAGVAFDRSGNLYGTTSLGGSNTYDGGGVVYKLSPAATGEWIETVVYAFSTFCTQGCMPTGDVVFGPAGDLYGTLQIGGQGGGIFRLNLGNRGNEFTFFLPAGDGTLPTAAILLDPLSHTFYGTASRGGGTGAGTVFTIVGNQATVLYDFCSQLDCADGSVPLGSLIEDKQGNLYGTTSLGGDVGGGVVFALSP